MKSPIRLSEVRNQDELTELNEFAKTFGHSIGDNSPQPVIRIYRGNRLLGYFFITPRVVTPCFHTDKTICTPRDFKDSIDQIRAISCFSSMNLQFPAGQCVMAVDEDLSIRKEIVDKMGFKDIKGRLYRFIG
jgi:hypothetical protein